MKKQKGTVIDGTPRDNGPKIRKSCKQFKLKHGQKASSGPIVNEEKSPVFYKCTYEGCEIKFADKSNRKKHVDSVHLNIRNFHCEFCGHSFKRSNTLKCHIEALHTKDVDKKQYKCDVCEKTFLRKIGLRLHQSLHTNIKSFVCSFEGCGKAFRLQTTFAKHEKRHLLLDKKPYQCRFCKEKFSRKAYLDSHMYKHTGMKNYRCEICEKTFSQKGNLATHKLLHSQDRPVYKCPQCPRTFTFKSNMKKHLQKHEIKEQCVNSRGSDKSGENITNEEICIKEEVSSQSGASDNES